MWNHYGKNGKHTEAWANFHLVDISFQSAFYIKNIIHIKIEIFLLIYLRKVCLGKSGGLVPKGNKPLPWPMETQLNNAPMRHQASMT